MRKISSLLLTLVFCSTALCLSAKEEIQDSTGQLFDKTTTLNAEGKSYNLQATGTAIRKKFVVKIYGVAHYLEDGVALTGDKFEEIINVDKAKQFTFKWLRSITAEQAQSGYQESFKAALTESDRQALDAEIKEYLAFYNQPVKKGDMHILRWIPGGTIELEINGTKAGSIKNPAFAKALWTIWFGPKSVVNRDDLISLIK